MKVSVIITAYNSQDTVEDSVDSALNQDFPSGEFEVVAVNDGSGDNTLEILKKYGTKIRLIDQENRGFLKAANRGFREAKGEYVVKLDSDDVFLPGALKEMAGALDENPEADFAYCDYYEKKVSGEKKLISTENIFNTVSGGIMYRKKKLEKEGSYDEDMIFAEYDLLLKTWGRWKGVRIAKPLFCYNRRPGSVTKNEELVEKAILYLQEKYPEHAKEIEKIREY